MTVKYFAYGSNLKSDRLKKRIPSVKKTNVAYLDSYMLVINKLSSDQTTKANIVYSPKESVIGIVYEIDESELSKLDRIEQDYDRKEVEVRIQGDTSQKAWTYLSSKTANYIRPHCWYMEFLINGAIENQFPEEYIDYLRSIECIRDPNV